MKTRAMLLFCGLGGLLAVAVARGSDLPQVDYVARSIAACSNNLVVIERMLTGSVDSDVVLDDAEIWRRLRQLGFRETLRCDLGGEYSIERYREHTSPVAECSVHGTLALMKEEPEAVARIVRGTMRERHWESRETARRMPMQILLVAALLAALGAIVRVRRRPHRNAALRASSVAAGVTLLVDSVVVTLLTRGAGAQVTVHAWELAIPIAAHAVFIGSVIVLSLGRSGFSLGSALGLVLVLALLLGITVTGLLPFALRAAISGAALANLALMLVLIPVLNMRIRHDQGAADSEGLDPGVGPKES